MNSDLENNKRIVLKYFEVMSDESNEDDHVDTLMSLLAEGVTYNIMGTYGVGGCFDKQHAKDSYNFAMSIVKKRFKFTIHSITAEEDRVVVEAQNTCEIINGEVYDNFYVFFFLVKDGKITRVNEYLDTLYLANMFGRVKQHTGETTKNDLPQLDEAKRAIDPYFANPIMRF